MQKKKQNPQKPQQTKPFSFKSLSKRDQLATIFSIETQILTEIGQNRAMLTQVLANQEAQKEQLDIIGNQQFLQQSVKEREEKP